MPDTATVPTAAIAALPVTVPPATDPPNGDFVQLLDAAANPPGAVAFLPAKTVLGCRPWGLGHKGDFFLLITCKV